MFIYAREFGLKIVTPKMLDRLDFKWPHAPDGQVKYTLRRNKNSGDKWVYAYYGETKEEIETKVNSYYVKLIQEHERAIAKIRERMVKL